MKRIVIPLIFSLIILTLFFFYENGSFSDKRLRVVFCDVGQGDAIYIRTPDGVDILVDGGPGSSVLECLSKYMPLTDRKIELVFATHPDSDHISGLVAVLRSYKVDSFNTVAAEKDTKIFRDMRALIAENNIPYRELVVGNKFSTPDGVNITTLWPEKNYENSDSNDHSLVKILSYGDFDLLLTGDVSFEILNSLALGGTDIEIFKLPHHGSKTGVDDSTMAKIGAKLAIISAGKSNSYGHPHPSVISLLNKYNMDYLRTDERGHIEIITDGKSTKIVN